MIQQSLLHATTRETNVSSGLKSFLNLFPPAALSGKMAMREQLTKKLIQLKAACLIILDSGGLV